MARSRRDFLKITASTASCFVMSVPLVSCAASNPALANIGDEHYVHDGFVQVTSQSEIHFILPRDEMGQGVHHGLATLIAEELDIKVDKIKVYFAPVHKTYNNLSYGAQGTWGSSSIRDHYLPLRQAAADTRATLLKAAAQQLAIAPQQLTCRDGFIWHDSKAYPVGDFVATAAKIESVKGAPLVADSQFKYIGKYSQRNDALAKVTGTARFSIDAKLTKAKRAVVIHAPVINGKVKDFDATRAKQQAGIVDIFAISSGIAVVAEHLWQAKKAAALVVTNWQASELAAFNSAELPDILASKIDSESGIKAHKSGRGRKALATASKRHSASYYAPYLAHATMEPMNCSAEVTASGCQVWVGSQSPEFARNGVAQLLDIDRERVQFHNHFIGGGFGRRVGIDFILEAVEIAKQVEGPVQLVWSREDDIRNDYYRPPSMAKFEAGVDENGQLSCYSVKRSGPNIFPYQLKEAVPAMLPELFPSGVSSWLAGVGGKVVNDWYAESSSVEGLFEDYQVAHKEVRQITYDPGVRNGYWRAVGHSHSGFFKESFIDEIAQLTERDPVDFRLAHLAEERMRNTLKLATQKAGWGQKLPAGHVHGVAVHKSLKTYVAQVVELSVEQGQIRIHKVTCAVDCGIVVNPDIVKAQMEGGILFGITAALYGNIDIVEGRVSQSNFHDYQMLRINQSPDIDVHLVESKVAPTGVGEPGLPPIAAAIGNAVFAATGQRLRQLPFKLSA